MRRAGWPEWWPHDVALHDEVKPGHRSRFPRAPTRATFARCYSPSCALCYGLPASYRRRPACSRFYAKEDVHRARQVRYFEASKPGRPERFPARAACPDIVAARVDYSYVQRLVNEAVTTLPYEQKPQKVPTRPSKSSPARALRRTASSAKSSSGRHRNGAPNPRLVMQSAAARHDAKLSATIRAQQPGSRRRYSRVPAARSRRAQRLGATAPCSAPSRRVTPTFTPSTRGLARARQHDRRRHHLRSRQRRR